VSLQELCFVPNLDGGTGCRISIGAGCQVAYVMRSCNNSCVNL